MQNVNFRDDQVFPISFEKLYDCRILGKKVPVVLAIIRQRFVLLNFL